MSVDRKPSVEHSSSSLAMPPQIPGATEGHRVAHLPIHILYGVKAALQGSFLTPGPPLYEADQEFLFLAHL